jgi:hypothetical protein
VGEQDALAVEVRGREGGGVTHTYVRSCRLWLCCTCSHHTPAVLCCCCPNTHAQIKSLQANLQRLCKAAAHIKSSDERAAIQRSLAEASATIKGVGPGGDM